MGLETKKKEMKKPNLHLKASKKKKPCPLFMLMDFGGRNERN